MRKSLVFLVFAFVAVTVSAQKLSISLFNDLALQTVLITPETEGYKLIAGDVVVDLKVNQILYISRSGDSVLVRDASKNYGKWRRASIVAQTAKGIIRFKPIMPAQPLRVYDDNLTFYIEFNRLMAINLVDQDKYIAGVVDSEAGPGAELEFYKAQSLIARTFAISHLDKHVGEGFNLCDNVHCQAYKGRSVRDPEILKATQETKGLIIVDSNNEPITAAFHANCGGETVNSEDVWLKSLPYLKAVNDPYCRSSRGATWEARIPMDDWKAFLEEKGVKVANLSPDDYVYKEKQRKVNYTIGGVTIPFADFRGKFNLRSTFFTIDISQSQIRLRGRGYGHGVGLCQEGAMQQARKKRTFEEIIHFYYTDVRIVNFSDIQPKENLESDSIAVDSLNRE